MIQLEKSVWVFSVCNRQALILLDAHPWILNIHPSFLFLKRHFIFSFGYHPTLLSMNVAWMAPTQATQSGFTHEQINQIVVHQGIPSPCPQRLIQVKPKQKKSDTTVGGRQIPRKDFWVPEPSYICVCYLWKFRDIK